MGDLAATYLINDRAAKAWVVPVARPDGRK
jgi:hypothetical protein